MNTWRASWARSTSSREASRSIDARRVCMSGKYKGNEKGQVRMQKSECRSKQTECPYADFFPSPCQTHLHSDRISTPGMLCDNSRASARVAYGPCQRA